MNGTILRNDLSHALAVWSENEKKRRADRCGQYQPPVNQLTDADVQAAFERSMNFYQPSDGQFIHRTAPVPACKFHECGQPSRLSADEQFAVWCLALATGWLVAAVLCGVGMELARWWNG